jgi:Ni/Co efflux regulator RcnB
MGRGDRGPAPQAAQPENRGNRGPAPQMAIQAPPNGEQNRGLDRGERDRGPAPQMTVQAPQNRGDQNRGDQGRGDQGRDFNRGERDRAAAPQLAAPQDRGGDRRMGFDRRGPENRNAFNDNRGGGGFNRDSRSNYRSPGFGGQRRDFSSFRDFHRDFRAPHRFQVRSYRRPSGWYSHRWSFGEFLPSAFWVRDYWLIDFADYDLPPPPYGAIWVRVDRDALLIDEDSGEIITVVYDVFY